MSRRRQRSTEYRLRRHIRRVLRANLPVRNTIEYMDWLVPRVAEGAVLDDLCRLTPVDADEFKRRLVAVRPARQLPDGTWDVEPGTA